MTPWCFRRAGVCDEGLLRQYRPGQRAMAALEKKLRAEVVSGVPADVVARSEARHRRSRGNRGMVARRRRRGGREHGLSYAYELTPGVGHWVPTSTVAQQPVHFSPTGARTARFAMPDGASCPAPPPPAYSESILGVLPEAVEVYEVKKSITPEQRAIAPLLGRTMRCCR